MAQLDEWQQQVNKIASYASFLEAHQKKVDDEYQDSNIHTQWKITQDMMHKLKFSFLELETKRRFLENIQVSTEQDIIPTDQKIADLEIATAQSKNQVKRSKQYTQTLFQQIENLATEWVQKRKVHQQYLQSCQYKLEQLQKWQDSTKDYFQDEEGYYRQIRYLDETNANALLHQRELQLSQLASSKQQLEDKRNELIWEIEPLESAVQQLRSHVSVLEQDANENIHEDDTRSKMKQIMTWYDNLIQFLQALSGVSIQVKDNNMVEIIISPEEDSILLAEEHQLIIEWNASRIVRAELVPEHISIQDWKQKWTKVTHIPYLVRETIHRLYAFHHELEQMRKAYKEEEQNLKYSNVVSLCQTWTIPTANTIRISINETIFLDLQFQIGYPDANTGFDIIRFFAATEEQRRWWKNTQVWSKLIALSTGSLIEWQREMRQIIRNTIQSSTTYSPPSSSS
ncbi:hypothetical protein GpartN1_g4809.t1 [Galdieria partita]|uniref:Kinetochore protein Sos7 coiled-coil domain-containing protein n=1 Tax=Galdieria partita TaxID=83374 RepID=A0A9C7PY19_9RHOD|nr:hypothetical protein GpartN1_g4809.t1 [Galdieria partita]